jgi:sugar/nucleoside kinase (ribokinase family)
MPMSEEAHSRDAERASAPETAEDCSLDVVALGSAIVDLLFEADEDEIVKLGLAKGSMTLVGIDESARVRGGLGVAVERSGGSAANTAVGVAMLGGRAGFVGKVAHDELGAVFIRDMTAAGVTVGRTSSRTTEEAPEEAAEEAPEEAAEDREVTGTGRCLVLMTEDGERTMLTHLGISSTLGPPDLDEDVVARGQVLYLEGYLWDVEDAKRAMRHAIHVAHSSDGLVALSLSDPFCVRRHQREFLDLIQGQVDVLFANEEEAQLLFASPDLDHVVFSLSETGLLAAVTRGAQGSVVVGPDGPTYLPAEPVERVVDTTGAGDLYAAGFLYGLTHGEDPPSCARIGGLCAAEIISHVGARPDSDLRSLVS